MTTNPNVTPSNPALSVPKQRPTCWHQETPAHLSELQAAHVESAVSGISAITAILYQRELDAEGAAMDEAEGEGLRLGSVTALGLLDALSCCAALVSCQMNIGRMAYAATTRQGVKTGV